MKTTKKEFTSLVWLVLVLPVLLAGTPAQGQQSAPGTYTTIDFPGAKDTVECCSAILNINDEGEIVGGYLDKSGKGHGFLLSHGSFTTIDVPASVYTEALGINSQGHIVGAYVDATNFNVHGFLLKDSEFTTIDFPGAINTFVNWINSEGDMVGGYMDAAGNFHGLLVRRGAFTSFDYPGASNTFGLGINAKGEIVGIYLDSSALNAHGFLFSKGRFDTFDFPGANTSVVACSGFGGGVTYTDGINDEGAIVGGYCGADDHYHGFLFNRDDGAAFSTIDFPGAVNSFTSGINSDDKIVGGYQSADGHYHGFVVSNSGVDMQIAISATNKSNQSPQVSMHNNIHKLLRARLGFGKLGWSRSLH